MTNNKIETAVFGGGCFWCTETVFERLKGVNKVSPGYAGGTMADPTYEQVSSGATGHAEVVKIEFDPKVISYNDLLTVLFAVHDPTTLNRQGNDVGTQYRSIIFYTNGEQKQQAEEFIKKLSANEFKSKKIVTEVKPLENFYEAEAYHHHYFTTHPNEGYCQIIINPKVKKLKEHFASLLK